MIRALQFSVAISALLNGLFAAPHPESHVGASRGQKTFSLDVVAVEGDDSRTAPKLSRRAHERHRLERYGIETTTRILDKREPQRQGSVATRPTHGDVRFLAKVRVGHSDLLLNIDTSSSDLWVLSTLQPAEQHVNLTANNIYDLKNSDAQQLHGQSFQIEYGDKSGASGPVYIEQVTIGGVTVEYQAIAVAETVRWGIVGDKKRDGMLGLGMTRLSMIRPNPQPTWFENIRPQLRRPVFTASLTRRGVGIYDFGFIDRSKYRGELIWTSVDSPKGDWVFETSGFSVGDGPMIPAKIIAVVDTATSLWAMPAEIVDAYYASVPGAYYNQEQEGWVFPCLVRLPDIGVHIGDQRFDVPGENMIYQVTTVVECYGGLQRNNALAQNVFGSVFLKGVFVAFESVEHAQPRMGFARQN